jgi:hypothetical protein
VAVCEEVGSGGDGDGHDGAAGGGIIFDARDGLALVLVCSVIVMIGYMLLTANLFDDTGKHGV